MANVEHIRGYVGPAPYDPKKDIIVDQKKFQEELNKKVQASTETDKQEQQKKKHIAKGSGTEEEEEAATVQGPAAPEAEVAFSAYMEEDKGPSLLDAAKTSRVVSSSAPEAAPLGAFDEDLSHVQDNILSTGQTEYVTASPPPPQTPPPPPPQPVAQQGFTEEPLLPETLQIPPEETPEPNAPSSTTQTSEASAPPSKPKVEKGVDTSLMGKAAPKKESFVEKRFRQKIEKARAEEAAAPRPAKTETTPAPSPKPAEPAALPQKQTAPTAEPKSTVPPPLPQPPVAAPLPGAAPQMTAAAPPLPTKKEELRGKVETAGVAESKAVRAPHEGGESDAQSGDKKHKQSEAEEAIQAITAPAGALPMPGIAPVEEAAPTAYTTLSPQIRELFDKMVGMITVQMQTGVTTTTVTVNLPGSPLQGIQVVLQQFDTARHAFNIQLEGTPEQLDILNANVEDLAAAFAGGKYAFSANILTPQLITKSPHLIHRKEAGGEKQQKQK